MFEPMRFVKKRLRPRLLGLYALVALAFWYASPTGTSIALGLVPIAIGEGIRLWATGHLHKNDALTVTGVYAYVRHPLYLGTLLIAAGFLAMAHSALYLRRGSRTGPESSVAPPSGLIVAGTKSLSSSSRIRCATARRSS